jgi:hypothetical protein
LLVNAWGVFVENGVGTKAVAITFDYDVLVGWNLKE